MHKVVRGFGWMCASAIGVAAHAGPSFEETLARSRSEAAETAGTGRSTTSYPNDITLSVGAPGVAVPRMTAPEVPREGPAVRVRHAWVFGETGTDALAPRVQLGLTLGPTGTTTASLEGTVLAWPVSQHSEVYASVERRHWGPGWTSSLILDGAAAPIAAFGWRRPSGGAFETPWLSWLGPWKADVFAGQLEGHETPAHPILIGMRLEIEPVRGLQLGASRGIQWGGRGRPQGFNNLVDALLGHDNIDSPDKSEEPGNQLGGFDARYRFDMASDKAVSVYAQAIGEDANRALPTAFLALFGADFMVRASGIDWRGFVEWSNTIAGDITGRPRYGAAYRHHIYQQGYTNEGYPLAAPIGGDAKLTSVGAIVDAGAVAGSLTLHSGRAGEFAQRYVPGSSLNGADASLSVALSDKSRAGLSAWHWRASGQGNNALQVWWKHDWP